MFPICQHPALRANSEQSAVCSSVVAQPTLIKARSDIIRGIFTDDIQQILGLFDFHLVNVKQAKIIEYKQDK